MNRLPFLSQRLFGVPRAIRPTRLEVVIGTLAKRLRVAYPAPESRWDCDDDLGGAGQVAS